MNDMNDRPSEVTPETRTLRLEREVPAPPEAVWEALTDPEGLRQWFALDARVEPGEGGSIWLSWGPGCEGEAPIHHWHPPRRLGWTESYGEDDAGRPIEIAVDLHVEGREGVTVVRLVQSGFRASDDWDAMYDALEDGWTYFLFNLAFYFLKHRDKKRKLVWRRVATDLAREALWERLIGGALIGLTSGGGAGHFDFHLDHARQGQVVSQRPGYHFAGTLPNLDDSVLFVELEGRHLGIWLSTYGFEDERVAELQGALDTRLEQVLGET